MVLSNPLVRKLEHLGALSGADRAVLEGICAEARHVAPGVDLAREGEAPEGVILVLDGFACRYKLRVNGARQIMAYLVPGNFCDLDVALLPSMDHSIATLSACQVMKLAPDVVEMLLERPALARVLRKVSLLEAANMREWLINLGRRSAIERLAHLFCELLVRLQAVGLVSDDRYDLPLTQADLADTTGLSSVHVNRSLQQLRGAGLIELRSRNLAILDLPGLEEMAEFRQSYLHLKDRAAA